MSGSSGSEPMPRPSASARPHGAPRLVGVGVGPGDPELMTLKAQRILNEADAILVPETEARSTSVGRAEAIVTAVCPGSETKIRRIPFSMSERSGVGPKRQESWQASAEAAVECFDAGAQLVAFATVGDASVYSTFSYLRATVAASRSDVEYEIIPGIMAMQAIAAESGIPLCEGQEVLALVPATVGPERIGVILDACDSVAIYKGGRTVQSVVAQLKQRDRDGVIGTNVSLPEQQIRAILDVDEAKLPYFSVVLSAPRRENIGGSL